MGLHRSIWSLIGYSRRLVSANKQAGHCCYRRIPEFRQLRLNLALQQCLHLLRVRHLPGHPILHRLLMRKFHHREAADVALAVAEGVLGAALAGAAAPWVRATHAENSVILGASVRNTLASVVTNWVIWRLVALLQLRPWIFHVLLRRVLCLGHLLLRRRPRRSAVLPLRLAGFRRRPGAPRCGAWWLPCLTPIRNLLSTSGLL